MSYSRYWRIGLIVLVVGLLAFGTNMVGLGGGEGQKCEGAWAAHIEGQPRYTARGNWATYVNYADFENKDFVPVDSAFFFAGQKDWMGMVWFIDIGDDQVRLIIGLCPYWEWCSGTNLYVQGYDSPPTGNPAPGRFEHKFEAPIGQLKVIDVPSAKYYGIHLNVYKK